MTDRDTHFAGFAKLLWEQLQSYGLTNIADYELPVSERDRINREIEQTTQEVIAKLAYDLVYHLVESAYEHRGTFQGEIRESIKMLPDLTEWPTP